jgi:AbrB family looped-hinge helix DNA binding protein
MSARLPVVTVQNRFQVVIPQAVRDSVGVKIGDLLEARAEKGTIVLRPRGVVDDGEYTPAQRRRIDAHLATSLTELKDGESIAFESHREMIDYLHRQTKRVRKASTPRRTPK